MKTTQLVPLTGTWPRIFLWIYVVSMVLLALSSLDGVRTTWPTFVGLAVFIVVAVVLSLDTAEPLSLWCAWLVVLVWPVVALLISWQLLEGGGHAQWFYGAGTVTLFYVSLRGRPWFAWVGFALLSAVVVVWGATTATGLAGGFALVGKQLPIMLVAALFAIGVRRAVSNIDRLTVEASVRASAEAADLATTAERNERLVGLDAVATPLLTKLVDGSALTTEDRLEFSLAEAELRDGLRARSLNVPSVIAAARAARRRGVDVVLLDDSDPERLDPTDLAAIVASVTRALDETAHGRVVARLLPAGREDVATILIDAPDSVRHDVVRSTVARTETGYDEGPAT